MPADGSGTPASQKETSCSDGENQALADDRSARRMSSLRSVPDADPQLEDASPLRHRLKRETAGLHRRLEAELGLLDAELTLDRYRRVLETFLGFYAPVEAGLAVVAAEGPPLGFPLRRRSELVERDLLSLGLSRPELAALPRCVDLPRLSRPEELAGCLYVLEGACLGGQMIAPILRERLGVAKDSGASFFVGDAEGTPARWTLVLTWLEDLPRTGAPTEAIVGSARATFRSLARWVKRRMAARPHL